MLRIKQLVDNHNSGFSIVVLWLFAFSATFTMNGKGDHVTFGLCVGPFETTLGFSLWRKLLP